MEPADLDPAPGVLLVAPPDLRDPNFRRTIVLLCEHNAEGSFGLILNRGLDLTLGDVLEELDDAEQPLSLGGPVQPNTLHFLHRYNEPIPDAESVLEGVQWGGNFPTIKALVESGQATPDAMRFFLGYAGWGAGQLDAEIDQDGWLLLPGTAELIFPAEPDTLWRDVLRRMGGEYALLSNYPDDPRMN